MPFLDTVVYINGRGRGGGGGAAKNNKTEHSGFYDYRIERYKKKI